IHRIRVDLPDPDGPQSTIFSPVRTDRLMSDKALNEPYHFSTPSMTIIGVDGSAASIADWLVIASVLVAVSDQLTSNGTPSTLVGNCTGSCFIHFLVILARSFISFSPRRVQAP